MAAKTWLLWLVVATVVICALFAFATDKYYLYENVIPFFIKNQTMEDTKKPRILEFNSTYDFKSKYIMEDAEKPRILKFNSTDDFKSIYIMEAIKYDNATVHKAHEKRKPKTLSCFNCPDWFSANYFKQCPYSECYFDHKGTNLTSADFVFFFPTPRKLPPRPPGQIWAYCSMESPVHYGYPCKYLHGNVTCHSQEYKHN